MAIDYKPLFSTGSYTRQQAEVLKRLSEQIVLEAVASVPPTTPGGSDGQIQYNSGGSFAGAPMVYAPGTNTLSAETVIASFSSLGLESPLEVQYGGTGGTTQAEARTGLGLGSLAVLNSPLAVANGGTGGTTQATARTGLGLGSLAVLNSPLAVANGGTGGTTQATARTGLGLGTAATHNVGTSGGTVPLLNGGNTWSGANGFLQDVQCSGTYYIGDGKNIVQFSDTWLRLNPNAHFSSGIYMAGSLVRTDSRLQVGSTTVAGLNVSTSIFNYLGNPVLYVERDLDMGAATGPFKLLSITSAGGDDFSAIHHTSLGMRYYNEVVLGSAIGFHIFFSGVAGGTTTVLCQMGVGSMQLGAGIPIAMPDSTAANTPVIRSVIGVPANADPPGSIAMSSNGNVYRRTTVSTWVAM